MKNFSLFTFCLLMSSVTFGQGSETFDNTAPALPTSYATGSFVGDNSVAWSYVESRDDAGYEITNDGLLLRRSANSSSVYATVPGGIGDFTCKLKKGFTGGGNRQVELFVNGISYGTSVAFDNTTVQTFTVTGINVTGSVIIRVDNITSKQVVIDDISWTAYSSSAAGIVLTAISGNTTESGGTATFDATLNTAPTTDVVIDVVSGDITENTVSTSTLTFTNGNYNVAQTITVTGVDDALVDGDQTTAITLTVDGAASDDAYDGLSKTVDVVNEDDDCAVSGVTVVPGCSGDDATFIVSWTATNTSGTIEVDIDGNGYVIMVSGATYTITGPTTAAAGVTVTVRDLNETTCFSTTTADISECPSSDPVAGDLLISEYMPDPSNIADGLGEYFELYNTTNNPIDIDGWIIKDDGSDSHTISTSNGTTVVPATGFLVLGIDSDNTDAAVDYEYSGITLSNSADEIILEFSSTEICRVDYTDGNDFGSGVANEIVSLSLHPTGVTTGPDNGSDYQAATTVMNSGDLGSPGVIGQSLPVELLYFTAKPNNQMAILTWATASEENNAYFNIQRSLDGKNFETIGNVEGNGTIYDVQEYVFIDESPVSGLNYYRLHQVDFDGQFENHKIVSVMMNGNDKVNNVQVYPNPTHGELNIVLPIIGENEIQILDLTGKVIRSLNTSGEGMITLDISDLANGQYIIKIRNAQVISTALFVKTK